MSPEIEGIVKLAMVLLTVLAVVKVMTKNNK